jgi:antitoxin (DNA-binding transcriptional repressor) of toxin-antitoxin stability system
MRSVGIYEAKTQLSRLVDAAATGETITITKHGAPVAELTAPRLGRERKYTADEAAALMDAWISYRDDHNITLGDGLTIGELVEEGRRY